MTNLPDFLIIPSAILTDEELQPLDGYVYGLVYWFTKLKLEKCIASNQEMAVLLHSSVSGISHALTRLSRKGYVQVILNDKNQREEIVPLIAFHTKAELDIIESKPLHKRATPLAQQNATPSSNVQHNKIDLKRKFNNKLAKPKFDKSKKKVDNVGITPDPVASPTNGHKNVERSAKGMQSMGEIMGQRRMPEVLPLEDSPIKTAHQAFGLEAVDQLKLPSQYKARIIGSCRDMPLHRIENAVEATLKKGLQLKNADERARYFFSVLHNNG